MPKMRNLKTSSFLKICGLITVKLTKSDSALCQTIKLLLLQIIHVYLARTAPYELVEFHDCTVQLVMESSAYVQYLLKACYNMGVKTLSLGAFIAIGNTLVW